MKKRSTKLLVLSMMSFSILNSNVLSLSSNLAHACTSDGKEGIVEENNLYISADQKSMTGITEQKFNQVIDQIEGIYAPVIRAKGKTLQVERNWSDGTVNAYAQQIGNTWKVSMFGGLARHETVTADGFALVLCHEIGHHMGGLPRKKGFFGGTWASNEGQSDYWGSMKCLRKYMEADDNIKLVKKMDVPEHVKNVCSESFADPQDEATCIRGSMAGLSLGNLFRALKRLRTKLDFTTPDRSVVSRTNDDHPAPQCRLDTYFAGSVCSVDHTVDVSDRDVNYGVCAASEGFTVGTRPLCWYKEETL